MEHEMKQWNIDVDRRTSLVALSQAEFNLCFCTLANHWLILEYTFWRGRAKTPILKSFEGKTTLILAKMPGQ
jgi:hypothetical protein